MNPDRIWLGTIIKKTVINFGLYIHTFRKTLASRFFKLTVKVKKNSFLHRVLDGFLKLANWCIIVLLSLKLTGIHLHLRLLYSCRMQKIFWTVYTVWCPSLPSIGVSGQRPPCATIKIVKYLLYFSLIFLAIILHNVRAVYNKNEIKSLTETSLFIV